MVKRYCCEEIKDAVKEDIIGFWLKEEGDNRFFIKINHEADDGDGYSFDWFDEITISFCPFCGQSFSLTGCGNGET